MAVEINRNRFYQNDSGLVVQSVDIQDVDVRTLVADIKKAIGALQILCDSPRESVVNDEALAYISTQTSAMLQVLSEVPQEKQANDDMNPEPSSAPRML